jgi:Protein of unknown function (DUF4236)
MGSFRFRRSMKVAPGVRLNFNKKSLGMSVGPRGARYSINSSGRRTRSVGIPGTGLSYRSQSGGSSSAEEVPRPSLLIRKLVFWLVVVLAFIGFASGADGIAVWVIVIGFFVWGGCFVLAPVVDTIFVWGVTRNQEAHQQVDEQGVPMLDSSEVAAQMEHLIALRDAGTISLSECTEKMLEVSRRGVFANGP